jgi:hypothetical protein
MRFARTIAPNCNAVEKASSSGFAYLMSAGAFPGL